MTQRYTLVKVKQNGISGHPLDTWHDFLNIRKQIELLNGQVSS